MISDLEQVILDLVQMAESPLYSTYRWLEHETGRDISFSEFRRVVNGGIEHGVFRLWILDVAGDRRELIEIPPDLESRYMKEPVLEDSHDPFGMSLTLGAHAVHEEPDWKVDVDFKKGVFELEFRASGDGTARSAVSADELVHNLSSTRR